VCVRVLCLLALGYIFTIYIYRYIRRPLGANRLWGSGDSFFNLQYSHLMNCSIVSHVLHVVLQHCNYVAWVLAKEVFVGCSYPQEPPRHPHLGMFPHLWDPPNTIKNQRVLKVLAIGTPQNEHPGSHDHQKHFHQNFILQPQGTPGLHFAAQASPTEPPGPHFTTQRHPRTLFYRPKVTQESMQKILPHSMLNKKPALDCASIYFKQQACRIWCLNLF
jgi:hypothetical protein